MHRRNYLINKIKVWNAINKVLVNELWGILEAMDSFKGVKIRNKNGIARKDFKLKIGLKPIEMDGVACAFRWELNESRAWIEIGGRIEGGHYVSREICVGDLQNGRLIGVSGYRDSVEIYKLLEEYSYDMLIKTKEEIQICRRKLQVLESEIPRSLEQ